eukprot:COSAG01_NODE_8689_length_2695_cov_1.637274_2_plen_229_part_00
MFMPSMLPINRGFASAFGYLCGSTGYFNHGNTINSCPGHPDGIFALDLHNGTEPAIGPYGGRWNGTYDTEMYSAALEELLDDPARNRSERLFLYIAPNNVHTPIAAPPRFFTQFASIVNKVSGSHAAIDLACAGGRVWRPSDFICSESRATGRHQGQRTMYADAAAMDAFVHNVTTALSVRDLWSNCTFIFTTGILPNSPIASHSRSLTLPVVQTTAEISTGAATTGV